MNIEDLKKTISVKQDGSIFLGKNVICDGSDYGIRNAVFTQIHSDRLTSFPTALQNCNNVIVSQPTADLLISDKINFGNFLKIKKNFRPIEFGKPFHDDDLKITLFDSLHVLGASQVLVDENGIKTLYSSEFRMSARTPIDTDILVLESSHGIPNFKKNLNEDDTLNQMIDLVREKLELGISIIFQAERGHLQELMSYLSQELPELTPFVSPQISCYFAEIYRNYGYEIRQLNVNGTENCKELLSLDVPVVQFISKNPIDELKIHEEISSMEIYKIEIGNDITTDSGNYSYDVVNKAAKFNIPIHASFDEVLEYVHECNPKLVITDNARTAYGEILAEEVTKRLSVPAYAYPIK